MASYEVWLVKEKRGNDVEGSGRGLPPYNTQSCVCKV